jgi:hypothetical protein
MKKFLFILSFLPALFFSSANAMQQHEELRFDNINTNKWTYLRDDSQMYVGKEELVQGLMPPEHKLVNIRCTMTSDIAPHEEVYGFYQLLLNGKHGSRIYSAGYKGFDTATSWHPIDVDDDNALIIYAHSLAANPHVRIKCMSTKA